MMRYPIEVAQRSSKTLQLLLKLGVKTNGVRIGAWETSSSDDPSTTILQAVCRDLRVSVETIELLMKYPGTEMTGIFQILFTSKSWAGQRGRHGEHKKLEIAKMLFGYPDAMAEINDRIENGVTFLFANLHKHSDHLLVTIFGRRDTCVTDVDENGCNLLHKVCPRSPELCEVVCTRFAEEGLDINAKDNKGDSPLDLLLRIIEYTPTKNAHKPARHHASEAKLADCVVVLIQHGAVATPIPKVKFRLAGGRVVQLKEKDCHALSEVFHIWLTTQVGASVSLPTDQRVFKLTDVSEGAFEIIKNIMEEKIVKTPVEPANVSLINELMGAADKYMITCVQKWLAPIIEEWILKNEASELLSQCEDSLDRVFQSM